MSREQTADDALILGMAKKLNLEELKDLYNKTDKTLSHYNKQGFTAFLAAVRLCNHEFISYLFRQNPTKIKDWVSQFSQTGQSALHILAEKCKDNDGLIKTATLLLDNGASIDALSKNDNPVTPLFLATLSKNIKLVFLYLKHNANINFKSNPPYSCTTYALTFSPKQNPTEILDQAKMREAFLLAACKIGDIDAISKLLTIGTNINIRDEETGLTPLHIAVGLQNLKCVELLLENSTKPDVNSVDNNGATPLVLSMTRRPYDDEDVIAITRILIKHGANIYHKVKIENSYVICLEFMAENCKRDAFDFVSPKEIQQYRSEKGLTLLHLAVNANNIGTHNASGPIGLFKDILGIDIRSANNGPTALEVVTANGTAECAQLLLLYNANPLAEVPGKKGLHAYAYAKSTDNDNPERAKILELIEDKLGIKHEKENVSQPPKPAVPNNLHMRLPNAPACKAVGKTPTLYQPLPKSKDDDIYVSSRLRTGQSVAAVSLPPAVRTVTAGGPASQRPK